MRHVRRGFTLIELVMVVSIISLVIAMLLPAVFRTRERARMLQCSHYLGQLALALHNYHATHRVLPSGCVNETAPVKFGLTTDNHFGWSVQILPQLDEANIWRLFDFKRTSYQQAALTIPLPSTFCCPSSPVTTPVQCYAACHHDSPGPIDVDNSGVLYLNSSLRLKDITDGKAQTLLIGEVVPAQAPGEWYQGTEATLRNPRLPFEESFSINPSMSPSTAADLYAKAAAAGTAVIPQQFGSFHQDGVHFAFCDGNVRYISRVIDDDVLRRLGNRHDGEVVGRF
jgi:prepilin-type N-terminal cleavage/methylation domain-containing protein/prepilin-type processing-associated H-X9-DG protein